MKKLHADALKPPSTEASRHRCSQVPGVWLFALAVGVFAYVGARDGLAQSSVNGFAGSWLRNGSAQADRSPLPKSILRVAVSDQVLAVEEPSAVTGPHRRLSHYRLEPQADRWVSVDGPQRMFRWLAPDRLELHDSILGPGARGTAVTELWELRDGGQVLRIRRTLRSLDDVAAKPEVRVSTFQRE
ncbi:MAG: hypothetical protein WBD07_08100 [Vicinamibacterales bacterium]